MTKWIQRALCVTFFSSVKNFSMVKSMTKTESGGGRIQSDNSSVLLGKEN